MSQPLGPVYQAGTLAGNPLAMSAGIATLNELAKPGVYDGVNALAKKLVHGLRRLSPVWGSSRRSTASVHFPPSSSRLIRSPITPGQALRHEALRPLFPRNAQPRHLPCAFAVRSRFHLRFPHFRRYRPHHCHAQEVLKFIAAQPSA